MDEGQLYTLRVWRQGGRWQAAVRPVGHETPCLFTEPAPLVVWLLQQAETPQPTQPDGPDSPGGL